MVCVCACVSECVFVYVNKCEWVSEWVCLFPVDLKFDKYSSCKRMAWTHKPLLLGIELQGCPVLRGIFSSLQKQGLRGKEIIKNYG